MSSNVATRYQFLGTTDSVTECGCCGRNGLKSTTALRDTLTDGIVYFGSQCGARAIGWGVKQFDQAAKQAQAAADKAASALYATGGIGELKSQQMLAICAVPRGIFSPEGKAIAAEFAPRVAAAHAAGIAAVLAVYPAYNVARFRG